MNPPRGQSGQQEEKMGHSEFGPEIRERRHWNAGRMVGAKRALMACSLDVSGTDASCARTNIPAREVIAATTSAIETTESR